MRKAEKFKGMMEEEAEVLEDRDFKILNQLRRKSLKRGRKG